MPLPAERAGELESKSKVTAAEVVVFTGLVAGVVEVGGELVVVEVGVTTLPVQDTARETSVITTTILAMFFTVTPPFKLQNPTLISRNGVYVYSPCASIVRSGRFMCPQYDQCGKRISCITSVA